MASPARRPMSRDVSVQITVDKNGQISVKPDPFWVSKGGNEEVWFSCTSTDPSNPNPDFTVRFNKNGTPFNDSVFTQQYPCSGLVQRKVKASKKIYNYRVTVGRNSLDPGGGVQE